MSTGNDDLEAWQRQRTVTLAFELADSGRHEDFTDIAYVLQFEHGLSTAQSLIDDGDMHRALNQRCGKAREAIAALKPVVIAPQAEEAVAPESSSSPEPSLLRCAAGMLWRTGARAIKPVGPGDLNSAPGRRAHTAFKRAFYASIVPFCRGNGGYAQERHTPKPLHLKK